MPGLITLIKEYKLRVQSLLTISFRSRRSLKASVGNLMSCVIHHISVINEPVVGCESEVLMLRVRVLSIFPSCKEWKVSVEPP